MSKTHTPPAAPAYEFNESFKFIHERAAIRVFGTVSTRMRWHQGHSCIPYRTVSVISLFQTLHLRVRQIMRHRSSVDAEQKNQNSCQVVLRCLACVCQVPPTFLCQVMPQSDPKSLTLCNRPLSQSASQFVTHSVARHRRRRLSAGHSFPVLASSLARFSLSLSFSSSFVSIILIPDLLSLSR